MEPEGRNHKPRASSRRGFTLIETITVIGLIALIAVLAVPSISSYFQVSIRSAVRDLATVVKDAYQATLVTGQVHRLVYDIGTGEYWVESGPPDFLLHTAESLEKEKDRLKYMKEDEKPPPPKFAIEASVTRKKLSLPRGVRFSAIYSGIGEDPVVEGVAYTHFFPHGLTEQTILHLLDSNDHQTSLVIPALTGKSILMQGHVARKDAFGE